MNSISSSHISYSPSYIISSLFHIFKKKMPNLRVNTMVSLNTKPGPKYSCKKYPIAWYISWEDSNEEAAKTLINSISDSIKKKLNKGEGDFENQKDDLGSYYYFYFKDVPSMSKVVEDALDDVTLCTNNFHFIKKNLRSKDIINLAEEVMELSKNPH